MRTCVCTRAHTRVRVHAYAYTRARRVRVYTRMRMRVRIRAWYAGELLDREIYGLFKKTRPMGQTCKKLHFQFSGESGGILWLKNHNFRFNWSYSRVCNAARRIHVYWRLQSCLGERTIPACICNEWRSCYSIWSHLANKTRRCPR